LSDIVKCPPKSSGHLLPANDGETRRFWDHRTDGVGRTLTVFHQVESSITRGHEGSGIGLPLSKSLAELHGGSLELESVVGVGTTVSVRLPPRLKTSATA